MRKMMMVATVLSGAKPYASTYVPAMKSLFGSAIVQFLSLGDLTGTVAADSGANSLPGAHHTVSLKQAGIGDGYYSTGYDGSTSYTNLYAAGLNTAMNKAEGSILIWVKIPQAAWDDNLVHYIIEIRADSNNTIYITKSGTSRISMYYKAGGAVQSFALDPVADIGWVPLGLTWSKSNDRVIPYRKGLQADTPATGLENWSGNLAATRCNLGCDLQTPTTPMLGFEAQYILLNREATPAEVLQAANPSGAASTPQTSWTIPQYAANTPVMIMTFDDWYPTVYTQAFKTIMQPMGIRGTFYVVTDDINGGGYISSSQLADMDAAGWSIANHTTDHTSLATVDQATATAKLADAKTALDTLGLTRASMHCSYPNGSYSDTVKAAAIAAGMLTGRRIYTLVEPDRYPDYVAANNYTIMSTHELKSGLTMGEALALIDRVIALRTTCLLYGHDINAPADALKWEPWMLQGLVTYCVNHNIPFITINEYYALQSGPVTVTR